MSERGNVSLPKLFNYLTKRNNVKNLPTSSNQIRRSAAKFSVYRTIVVLGRCHPAKVLFPLTPPAWLSASWPRQSSKHDTTHFCQLTQFNDGKRSILIGIPREFVSPNAGHLERLLLGELKLVMAVIARQRGWKNIFLRQGCDKVGLAILIVSNKIRANQGRRGHAPDCRPDELEINFELS